jgi:hypothetical protein
MFQFSHLLPVVIMEHDMHSGHGPFGDHSFLSQILHEVTKQNQTNLPYFWQFVARSADLY